MSGNRINTPATISTSSHLATHPPLHFPELELLLTLKGKLASHAKILEHGQVNCSPHQFPLLSFSLGSTNPKAPVLAIVGGVHGLERIGTQVALAFLSLISERLTWDATLRWELERVKILFYPLVNPGGMYKHFRSNLNGVDLNRNTPVEGVNPSFLLGGHRLSPKLPWFRGLKDKPMELEAQCLLDFIQKETAQAPVTLLLDCHSGFGFKDQIWYPWASSREPFPREREILNLKNLLNSTHPNHVYIFEPQAKNYTTHGDLWDYATLKQFHTSPSGVFLPLTLEMGSWNWLKKNPLQAFSSLGFFNPIKTHRVHRTLRRHLPLFDFLLRSLNSLKPWWN